MAVTPPEGPRRQSFGSFEMDHRAGELRRAGIVVRLQDLPLRILEILLERPGEIVAREELRERLWEPDTHVDFDNSLNAAVSKLREALGDRPDRPRYIATVPRRGYRLVAAVTGDDGEAASSSVSLPSPREGARSPGKGGLVFAAAGAAIAVLLAVFAVRTILERGGDTARGLDAPPRRVAVLPLDDLSAEPEAYFADGLTEEITSALGRLAPGRLGVIGRTSVRRYKGRAPTARELGEELGVGHVLSGSVRRDGDDVRISVELVDTATQTRVWSESYDRRLDAVFALQGEIARRVAGSLSVRLLPGRPGATAPSGSGSMEAVEAYLEGRFLLQRRTKDAMERALTLFEGALRLDPDWTAPRLGLAASYLLLGMHDYRRPHDALPQARLAARRALLAEPDSAMGHLIMALVRMAYDWDWAGAETEFRRALALEPDLAEAHEAYAGFLSSRGRVDEALASIRHARQLDPLSMTVRAEHGWILFFGRRTQEAEEVLREAVALDPNHLPARDNLKWVRAATGRHEAAFEDLLEVIRLEGTPPAEVEAFRQRHTPLDWPAVVRGIISDMEKQAATGYQSPYDIALECAQLGDVEPALGWLERAIEAREIDLISIEVDPRLDALRPDARFATLVERVQASAVTAGP